MNIQIFSPQNYQVFQRRQKEYGTAILSGFLTKEVDALSVKIDEIKTDKTIATFCIEMEDKSDFLYQKELPSGGWYRLEIQAVKDNIVMEKSVVEHFGIGEVFATSGQSNSTNYGEECSRQTSNMVACFADNTWSLAEDPLRGAHDISKGGSPWLFFGDYLYSKLNVPIGIAITGHGGTTVKEWLPNGVYCQQSEEKQGLFNWMVMRLQQLGIQGFRAVLWHQGESDANSTTYEKYFERLKTIIDTSRQQCGWYIPWFVAIVSYRSKEEPRSNCIREAQKKICSDGIAFCGPDTDLLIDENRDFKGEGIHFSLKGLKAHGEIWGEKIEKWLKNNKI